MWWAAQVASNKEYDTKREIVSGQMLSEEDVLIPRMQVYDTSGDELKKKTEEMMPGYLLLKLGQHAVLAGIESLNNYMKILGPVTDDEMDVIRQHENIPEDPEVDNGDKIIVTRGPFMGVKGTTLGKEESGRYMCRLVFHGNEIEVDLEPNIIEKIS